jgi:hypothetical protein
MKHIVLFFDDGDPIDYRCIKRFISSFSPSYTDTVQTIIPNSEKIEEQTFKFNIARLMPSFGMTRVGAFHGLGLKKDGTIRDPNHVTDLCWKKVGKTLQKVKLHIQQNTKIERRRVIAEFPLETENYVIKEINGAFHDLSQIQIGTSIIGRVGASKVLFSVMPEVALPVDNSEWDDVFRTDSYEEILTTMIEEIKAWEGKTQKKLEASDPQPLTTLPSIYNVMAMSARSLEKLWEAETPVNAGENREKVLKAFQALPKGNGMDIKEVSKRSGLKWPYGAVKTLIAEGVLERKHFGKKYGYRLK